MEPFKVLCADPPWQLDDKLPGKTRGAGKNYRTMHYEEIAEMKLPPLADDAWLFLWRLSSMQDEALFVVQQWGFKVKSEVVWDKVTKHGEPWFGMGRYVRASHETAIVAVRGKVTPVYKNVRSRFAANVPVDGSGKYVHSAKPEAFYRQVVERLAPGPYVELFARRKRPGWTTIGDMR